jgi:hypothetical protein
MFSTETNDSLHNGREIYQIWKVKKVKSVVGHWLSKFHCRVFQCLNPKDDNLRNNVCLQLQDLFFNIFI